MIMQRMACWFVLLAFLASPLSAQQKEKPKWPPSPHVAATEPLRPEEQIKKIKLPAGFELQLVAADPDIRKPININFDAAGRLWITETIEYPFAAKDGQGRDAVKILEDFGPDGRARKITTFADKLNIPIGVIPTAQGALVYSIPSIYHMTDSNGTGKADKREVFYTQFGTQDTHGMTGEFQQGFDGWIYACHGFSNTSKVKSKGDTAITMQSGNTYRIKADGSRIEQFTWGQVNPFGLAFDPYGNLYSGDCHSEPLTMLLRGGWYKSFAKPDDGLGFAPHMNTFGKEHSTALCGVVYYAADQFPKEYHGKMFLGDVVENRINAYRLEWTGATPKAIFEPFLTCSDPWFRPVDIKLGPDGCIYFADFYNRIIGHYEVALNHPGRDRDKGRIWRIVYRGTDGKSGPQPVTNLAKADTLKLAGALGHANLTVRLQATHQLVERGDAEVVAAMQPIVKDVTDEGQSDAKVHAIWVLERLGKLDDGALAQASSSKEKAVRVHAQRILTEKKSWTPKYAAMAKFGLLDADALVRRVAVEAMAAHPAADQVNDLIRLHERVNVGDTHLIYAIRLALRDQLRNPEAWKTLRLPTKYERSQRVIADVCLGVRNLPSTEWLKAYLGTAPENYDRTSAFTRYIIRNGVENATSWAITFAHSKGRENLVYQAAILKATLQGAQERGIKLTNQDRESAGAGVAELLKTPALDVVQSGVELAGALKLTKMQPQILALVNQAKTPEALRKACITSLVAIDAKEAVEPLTQLLLNEKEAIAIREQTANALAGTNHPDAHAALVKALQNAPARLQTTIALGMAGSPQGGERLLQAIEIGKASRHLLQDRAIELRLSNAKIGNVKDRLKTLTQGLPAADQKAQELITKRRDAFTSFKGDAEVGQKIYQKNCANCHQIANQGAKVGPNLDGVGARGLERLLEDVLDPNRNVDQAFRRTVVITKDGKTIDGLFLRDEGNITILADKDGKDVRIDKANIEERSTSPLSPMPGNFAELLSEPDFHHLMAYLLGQRAKQ
jgi:putative heme-binding domain-containing protein